MPFDDGPEVLQLGPGPPERQLGRVESFLVLFGQLARCHGFLFGCIAGDRAGRQCFSLIFQLAAILGGGCDGLGVFSALIHPIFGSQGSLGVVGCIEHGAGFFEAALRISELDERWPTRETVSTLLMTQRKKAMKTRMNWVLRLYQPEAWSITSLNQDPTFFRNASRSSPAWVRKAERAVLIELSAIMAMVWAALEREEILAEGVEGTEGRLDLTFEGCPKRVVGDGGDGGEQVIGPLFEHADGAERFDIAAFYLCERAHDRLDCVLDSVLRVAGGEAGGHSLEYGESRAETVPEGCRSARRRRGGRSLGKRDRRQGADCVVIGEDVKEYINKCAVGDVPGHIRELRQCAVEAAFGAIRQP